MSLIEWSQAYSVDISSIDEQHKHFIKLINALHDGMQAKRSHEALQIVMDELIQYVDKHFGLEEQIFSQTNYPDATNHVIEHNVFKKSIAEIQSRMKAGGQGTLTLEVLNFLRNWLLVHINGTDKKYSKHFQANHIS